MGWKRKKNKRFRFWKIKVICVMLLTGMFWCPITLLYSVKHPDKAIIYLAKMGIVVNRIKVDVGDKVSKLIPPAVKRIYHRYGISDTLAFASAAVQEVRGEPTPSLFTRISQGVWNTGKWLCFWSR